MIRTLALFGILFGTLALRPQITAAVESGQPAVPYTCNKLDYGIYWYSYNDTSQKAYSDGRAIPGFYDPSKPTIIFTHGWERNRVSDGRLAGTNLSEGRTNFAWRLYDTNVAEFWLDQGWNVGLFQWTQLANDRASPGLTFFPSPYFAQSKIWTPDGPAGMRWAKCSKDEYEDRPEFTPGVSVARLFYEAYQDALAQYSGSEIRLAGNSLGAQLVIAMAQIAYTEDQLPSSRRPQRIALLDPYWGPTRGFDYSFMPGGKRPGEISREYVQALKQQGVVFEWVKSSAVNEYNWGDTNEPLIDTISRTDYKLDLPEDSSIWNYHKAGWVLYFWSKDFPAPDECTQSSTPDEGCTPTGRTAYASSNTIERASEIMDPDGDLETSDGGRWEQVTGRTTGTAEDDTFRCIGRCPCSDTALVFDTTASMDGILGDVQTAATSIVGQLFTINPSARIAVVEYRDSEADAFGARTVLPLSTDQGAIVNAINSLTAQGGGDTPEFVLSGVREAIGLDWFDGQTGTILLIGDAAAKDPEPLSGFTTISTINVALANRLVIHGLPQGSAAAASFTPLANGTSGSIFSSSDYPTIVQAVTAACSLPEGCTRIPQLYGMHSVRKL
ncbi:VWA domain-containing protein [Candidatus Gracilibacteria bacterium]|nr:VWA domain-containing protein [Candidatus Gracilibacteria bacterium]